MTTEVVEPLPPALVWDSSTSTSAPLVERFHGRRQARRACAHHDDVHVLGLGDFAGVLGSCVDHAGRGARVV